MIAQAAQGNTNWALEALGMILAFALVGAAFAWFIARK